MAPTGSDGDGLMESDGKASWHFDIINCLESTISGTPSQIHLHSTLFDRNSGLLGGLAYSGEKLTDRHSAQFAHHEATQYSRCAQNTAACQDPHISQPSQLITTQQGCSKNVLHVAGMLTCKLTPKVKMVERMI